MLENIKVEKCLFWKRFRDGGKELKCVRFFCCFGEFRVVVLVWGLKDRDEIEEIFLRKGKY